MIVAAIHVHVEYSHACDDLEYPTTSLSHSAWKTWTIVQKWSEIYAQYLEKTLNTNTAHVHVHVCTQLCSIVSWKL